MARSSTSHTSPESWPRLPASGSIDGLGRFPAPTGSSAPLLEEQNDFHDPYSDLNLFLSRKIKEEMKTTGVVKKWSQFIQDKLVAAITPELQRKFPQCRLRIASLRKAWEKIAYYSQQIQHQKEAVTQDGKLNISFLIKENLRQYIHFKSSSQLHPYLYAHQLALKVSEWVATLDGVRPKLDQLTKTIWAVQRHLLKTDSFDAAQLPAHDFDAIDKVIVKTVLETTGKEPFIEQKELEQKVRQSVQSLQELPAFTSIDQLHATVSVLLADKLCPISCFQTAYFSEQREVAVQFIDRHLSLCKSSFPQLADLVRRIAALYKLASQLPKDMNPADLPQAAHAFTSAERLLGSSAEEIVAITQLALKLPPLSDEVLEMVIWKQLGQLEKLLEKLPFRIGQKIEEEIANTLIDNPSFGFSSIVSNTVSFFKKAKELASSKKWADLEAKIHIWTIQGDLLCRWIRFETDVSLLKLISEMWKENSGLDHAAFVSQVAQQHIRTHPQLIPYSPQVTLRIWTLYKYAWYAQLSTAQESSMDRFLKWHISHLSCQSPTLSKQDLIKQLEEICKKIIPLIPFDLNLCNQLLASYQPQPEQEKRQA
jgi:hypothetical protein